MKKFMFILALLCAFQLRAEPLFYGTTTLDGTAGTSTIWELPADAGTCAITLSGTFTSIQTISLSYDKKSTYVPIYLAGHIGTMPLACAGATHLRVLVTTTATGSPVATLVATRQFNKQLVRTLTLFSGTSPAAATAGDNGGQTPVSIAGADKCIIKVKGQGATGGTLSIYVQTTYDGGATWTDLTASASMAAAAAQTTVAQTVTVSHNGNNIAPVTLNNTNTPTLAAAGAGAHQTLGTFLRVVFVAGAGTSAGAAQTVVALCAM